MRQTASDPRSTLPPIRNSAELQELTLQDLLRCVGRELKLEIVSNRRIGSAELIMQSERPAAERAPQDSTEKNSIKRTFQKYLNPLVEARLADWRHGGRPGMPTFRDEEIVHVTSRVRIQTRGRSAGREQHLEVPGSGENSPRSRK